MSTTEMMDLERLEIIRMLFAVDSSEVLDSVKRTISRYLSAPASVTGKEALTPPCRFTVEELNRELDEAEAQEGGVPSDIVFARMEKKYTFLCK